MAKITGVDVVTLRTIWVSVGIDTTDWNEDEKRYDAYLEEATEELLDAIQVTENNSPNIKFHLESLDGVEITHVPAGFRVLPQN